MPRWTNAWRVESQAINHLARPPLIPDLEVCPRALPTWSHQLPATLGVHFNWPPGGSLLLPSAPVKVPEVGSTELDAEGASKDEGGAGEVPNDEVDAEGGARDEGGAEEVPNEEALDDAEGELDGGAWGAAGFESPGFVEASSCIVEAIPDARFRRAEKMPSANQASIFGG